MKTLIMLCKYFRWFCHFDDDIFVNIPALVATLGQYNPSEERRYFGKWSVNKKEKMEVSLYATVPHISRIVSSSFGFFVCLLYSHAWQIKEHGQLDGNY